MNANVNAKMFPSLGVFPRFRRRADVKIQTLNHQRDVFAGLLGNLSQWGHFTVDIYPKRARVALQVVSCVWFGTVLQTFNVSVCPL